MDDPFRAQREAGGIALIALSIVYRTPQAWKDSRAEQGWKSALAHLDFLGSALVLAGLICFLLVMQRAGITWAWTSPQVISLLVFSVLLAEAFCWNEWVMGEQDMVVLRLLRRKIVWLNCAYAFFMFSVYFPLWYFLPLYFQAVQGVDAQLGGIRNIPFMFGVSGCCVVATYIMGRTGHLMPIQAVGAALATAGAAAIFTLKVDSTAGEWIGYQIIAGAGIGIGLEVAIIANQKRLPPADVPAVIGLTMFFELLGAAVFVSVAQNIFSNRLLHNVATFAPEVDPAAVLGHGAGRLSDAFDQSSAAVV